MKNYTKEEMLELFREDGYEVIEEEKAILIGIDGTCAVLRNNLQSIRNFFNEVFGKGYADEE